MSNQQPELDAPNVEVTKLDFIIDTPSSTDKITKKGYWVVVKGKPSADANFYTLSAEKVTKDGEGVIAKIEKSNERLHGHKNVDFMFTMEDEIGERLGQSKVISVAS